jgi:hypothetical protein
MKESMQVVTYTLAAVWLSSPIVLLLQTAGVWRA